MDQKMWLKQEHCNFILLKTKHKILGDFSILHNDSLLYSFLMFISNSWIYNSISTLSKLFSKHFSGNEIIKVKFDICVVFIGHFT